MQTEFLYNVVITVLASKHYYSAVSMKREAREYHDKREDITV